MKMKIPNEALGAIAVAASNVSTKHFANTSPPADAVVAVDTTHAIVAGPQIPRRLKEQLATTTTTRRSLAATNDDNASCDASFLKCILSPTCRSCFQTLQENEIDWANVVPDTPCQDVLGFLVSGGHCQDVRGAGGTEELDTFCGAFDACVVWDDDDDDIKGGTNASSAAAAGEAMDDAKIDCTTLTECYWPGMHEHFLGDGVCHDAMPGCYNSKACNYDGGDCCEDTCHYPGGSSGAGPGGDVYGECGQEGYACRDPTSDHCQPALARSYKEFCQKESMEMAGDGVAMFDDDEFKEEERIPDCSSSETMYRLVQYDSWGDGWDETVLTLNEVSSTTNLYSGGLAYGSQGTVHLCLTKKDPKCYRVKVENGVWGNEISWELRPLAGGAPALAAGGAPSDCTVPLGGTVPDCPNTCDTTRPDTKIDDPNYKSYKDMESCIEKKCLIQVGNCAQDESCGECMQDESPDFCFANENFNVLIDCSMCSCTEARPDYCDAKSGGAAAASTSGSSAATHGGTIKVKPASPPGQMAGSATGGTAVCAPEQTLKGTSALVDFSDCADVDKMMAMVTEFDNENFGMLDLFESCALEYAKDPNQAGKSAMSCMKILHDIFQDEEDRDEKDNDDYKNFPTKNAKGEALPENVGRAVGALGWHLYNDAEDFCSCASHINKDTPTCSSFINFKTLLYETVDACKSLDAIDCAAWEEFYTPCRKNLVQMYDTVDFDKDDQCNYVRNQCGGAGPFPAFRRMDCGGEIAKPAWDFHTMYMRGCLKAGSGALPSPGLPSPSPPTPAIAPSTPRIPTYTSPSSTSSTTEKKQYKPYGANGATDEKKPYYSPSYSNSDPEPEDASSEYSEKKKHHFLRNTFILMILAGAGFFVHKKRREDFNYMRFRQLREARNYAGGLNAGGGGGGGGGNYTGVSMADSCSFEPPTLPPTPSDNTTMI